VTPVTVRLPDIFIIDPAEDERIRCELTDRR